MDQNTWLLNAILYGVYPPQSGGGGGSVTPLQVQKSSFNFAVESGANDVFVVTLNPAVVSLSNGLLIFTTAEHTNLTTTPTLNINGTGAKVIVTSGQQALIPGDVVSGVDYMFMYDSGNDNYQILNPSISIANSYLVQKNFFNFAPDTGAANAYVANLPVTPLTVLTSGISALIEITHANTGASTLNLNSSGVTAIVNGDGSALTSGQLAVGMIAFVVYSDTLSSWVLMNPIVSSGGGGVTSTQVQQSAFNVGIDSGTANNYVVTLDPPITSLTNGMLLTFTPLNSSTNTFPTIDVGTGPFPFVLNSSNNYGTVSPGDLLSTQPAFIQYNSIGEWTLLNPASGPTSGQVQGASFSFGTDTGTADNYLVAITPTGLPAPQNGSIVNFLPVNANVTTTPTLNLNNTAAATITLAGGNPVPAGAIAFPYLCSVQYNANSNTWILLTPAVVIGTALSSIVTSITPVSVSTTTVTEITSIELTQGTWDIFGNVTFIPTSSSVKSLTGFASNQNTALIDPSAMCQISYPTTGSLLALPLGFSVPYTQLVVPSGGATVYLMAEAVFTSGSMHACGVLYAKQAT